MLARLLLFILILHCIALSYQQICNYQDQSSILAFSAHISIPSPSLNWSSSTDCCRWEGINCDMSGKVTHLQLPSRGIKGVITSFINNLTSLTHLNLSNNFLRGPLGEGIVSLTNLRIIDLSLNYISGSIPKDIGNLLYLEKLHLSSNSFSGPIPPSLMNCKNLVEIILRFNLLEGDISVLDFSKLHKLQKLDIGFNNFNGTLPESIYSCKLLIAIRVRRNNITGQISPKGVALRSLSFLSLCGNSLTNITKALRVLAKCKNLTTLCLGSNFYNEILPIHKDFITLNDFPKLRFLDIGNGSFGGPIPNWLSNMKRLNHLLLCANKFIGKITDWIGTLPNLSRLNLDGNNLSGEFPLALCKLPALVSNDTNLETYALELPVYSTIGDGYTNFTQIKAFRRGISMSFNKLSGNIPSEIGNLQNLQMLNLSNNNFSQKIPVTISNLKKMEILDLSTNSLTGEIPMSFASLHFLSIFNVSYNNLEGPIPTGGQLDTFQVSSFEGNPGLCGEPVNRTCSNETRPMVEGMSKTCPGSKQMFVDGLFIGFAFGFCGVLAIIAAYFLFNYY